MGLDKKIKNVLPYERKALYLSLISIIIINCVQLYNKIRDDYIFFSFFFSKRRISLAFWADSDLSNIVEP